MTTQSDVRDEILSYLYSIGMPAHFEFQIDENMTELGIHLPVPTNSELSIYSSLHDLDVLYHGLPTVSCRVSRRFLEWPQSLRNIALRFAIKDELKAIENFSWSTEWGSIEEIYAALDIEGLTPPLWYSSNTFVTVCEACGHIEVTEVLAAAYGDGSWPTQCLRCGEAPRTFLVGESICKYEERYFFIDECSEERDALVNLQNLESRSLIDFAEYFGEGVIASSMNQFARAIWKAKGGMLFDDALSYLANHSDDGRFLQEVDIFPMQVCSKTRRIEDSDSCLVNDATEVWIEADLYHETGGGTYEEAVIHLAHLYKATAGNNPFGFVRDFD